MLDHQTALTRCIQALKEAKALGDISQIEAVGHRVVHGGERYSASVMIDEEVEKVIQQCSELAPLHNPHNLRGYLVSAKFFPRSRKLQCLTRRFITPCLPRLISTACPIPITGVTESRRYGFHSTSHRYVAFYCRQMLGKRKEEANLITAHLGNGCSITAIEKGQSVDTSMARHPTFSGRCSSRSRIIAMIL